MLSMAWGSWGVTPIPGRVVASFYTPEAESGPVGCDKDSMDHPHLPVRRLGATTLLVLAVMVLAACTSTSSRALVGPTTTAPEIAAPGDAPTGIQPPPGWKLPDTRNAVLLAAPSKAKSVPIAVVGGTSTVSGVVTGPDGPVPGATVRVERFVGTASGSVQVGTDGSGRFVLRSALGGRYRVRAWLQPDLATFVSPTGFVAAGDSLDLSPNVERHNAVSLQLAAGDATLTMGTPGQVRALLTRETVDSNGIVQAGGVAGSVITLVSAEGLTVTSPNPTTTDATGAAVWVIECTVLGAHLVSASAAEGSASTTLPPCAVSGPSTSTTTSTTSTTIPGNRTTTTTRPGGPGR